MALNNIKDLTGMRFGRIVALKQTDKRKGKRVIWLCKCDCGNVVERVGSSLKNGVRSCGCIGKEKFEINRIKPKHNMYNTRPYIIWHGMKQRVLNPNSEKFHHYGGRGITICDKWLEFQGFWEDMKDGYKSNLTLDRIDVNSNYEKINCRWITQHEQLNNKRTNIIVCIDGITASLKQHTERLGLTYGTIINRINKHGWSAEEALTVPIKTKYRGTKAP